MLNLCTKCTVLIRDVIWLNETYSEYLSRKENTKENTYILQDEEGSYNWDNVKMDPVKTENLKTEENVKSEKYYRAEEEVQKTTKTVFFAKQENIAK